MLISLLMLSLITIIAVAFLGTMNWELAASRRNYDNQKAQALAMLGMKTAVAQLRHGLDTWDNPYFNFATNPPAFYWSMSPGLITRWSYTSTTPLTNYPLFSIDPNGATNLVNLNAVMGDGTYPIAGITNTTVTGATAPNISVYWVNVLKNPANSTASSVNPLIGRYAFWVDDENAKINVNTADGTMKYQTNSLGLGSPSEMSLQALQQGGAALSSTVVTNIVYLARTTGLNSPKEVLRAAGTTPDLYTNNEFNLTAYSRSPDLNIFGQPKMVLTPILGNSTQTVNDMTTNSITLQASREIYPTPSQLPTYSVIIPPKVQSGVYTWHPTSPNTTATLQPYPLAFRGALGNYSAGAFAAIGPGNSNQEYLRANYQWINGLMLANYLAGTNAAYKPVTWPVLPVFPGTSGTAASGFSGKYTSRQIDSIVAQITSLGAKEISPDVTYAANSDVWVGQNRGLYSVTTPFLFFGWLSHEWVSGMGRVPKLDSIEVRIYTQPATGSPGPPGSANAIAYHPGVSMDIWQEWWLPANYLGGKNDITITSTWGSIPIGEQYNIRALNMSDLFQASNQTPTPGASLPTTNSSDPVYPVGYWGNQLLMNNQGIDFQCNPNYSIGTVITNNALGVPVTNTGVQIPIADPDQAMAAQYHYPFDYNTNNNTYSGAGIRSGNAILMDTPFAMTSPQGASSGATTWKDWQPGTVRCVQSYNGLMAPMPMQTNSTNPTLIISGGIQERAVLGNSTGITSDPDPVPLEAIRGISNQALGSGGVPYVLTGEFWTDPATPLPGDTNTVRSRVMQEVIPISLSATIGPPNTIAQYYSYDYIKVADPLVNKFPGDWTTAGGATVQNSSTAPTVPSYWTGSGITDASVASSSEYASGFHSSLSDPDSYWLPQADVPACNLNDVASETIIPRSARCPNIGYLQYVRTGIMPDTPTPLTPALEHGTPFRLLSYAPISETANQQTTASGSAAYPDWAMLDLLYIPSTLAPYGGPYGYYETNSVWKGYGNPTVLANNSTGGGSSPGRINPNGVVIYTTNVTVPQPGLARTVPLQALMYGLSVNQTNNISTVTPNPGYSGGTPVDASISESDANSIPVAIEAYIRAHGPLRLPGELCNVPAIAALRPTVNATRNDLIRQIIGNVTVQSDTFSVWVAGQSLSKSLGNTGGLSATDPNWGLYQAGDQILSSVRYHFIVERYLDPGADGVYGNSVNPGADLVYGTYDDPVDPVNHPFQPRYLYRVVAAEEIR